MFHTVLLPIAFPEHQSGRLPWKFFITAPSPPEVGIVSGSGSDNIDSYCSLSNSSNFVRLEYSISRD